MGSFTTRSNNSGFTLVELSIVLVIIGLLVGGVLQGRELIEASKRHALISDITKYQVALNTFKLQYDGVPGDFDEATDYWVDATGNGNGDGEITIAGYPTAKESVFAWQHLSLSEIIPGNYTGDWVSAGTQNLELGVNIPESPYSAVGYMLGATGIYGNSKFDVVWFAGERPSDGMFFNSAVSPKDAMAIERKIDDGVPNKGRAYTTRGGDYTGVSGKCVDADYSSTSDAVNFILSDAEVSCRMYFQID